MQSNASGMTPTGIELRHLRYFVAVADAGTFTHAAERMFLAQATLSQQIRRLEEMIGTPLLQRCREGVRLTDAGKVLLEDSRTLLSLAESGMGRARQAAGLGRPRLRVAICNGVPEALRLRDTAASARVEAAWLETALDTEFTVIREHRADAGLGWLPPAGQPLPAPLDVMELGTFEPEVWVPAVHPAARRQAISVGELILLDVVHGPRRAGAGTYDAWRAVLRSADPQFEFTDPPFRQSSLITLAFASAASRPTAVLTGPCRLTTTRKAARDDRSASSYDMVRVRIDQSPLTANAGLVWNGDLPRPLQQVLFDTADGITLTA